MNRATDSHPGFTPRQGQYLAFIHAYTLVNGRPPAQADIQRFFRLTPPSVHQMLLTLERAGLISRRAGVPRSIAILVDRSVLPQLEPGHPQPVKFTVTGYEWQSRSRLGDARGRGTKHCEHRAREHHRPDHDLPALVCEPDCLRRGEV